MSREWDLGLDLNKVFLRWLKSFQIEGLVELVADLPHCSQEGSVRSMDDIHCHYLMSLLPVGEEHRVRLEVHYLSPELCLLGFPKEHYE